MMSGQKVWEYEYMVQCIYHLTNYVLLKKLFPGELALYERQIDGTWMPVFLWETHKIR